MVPTFNFQTSALADYPKDLLLEVGGNCISFVITDEQMNCVQFATYHLPNGLTGEKLKEYLKDIIYDHSLNYSPFRKINIIYSFPEAVLIPEEFMNRNAAAEMLKLLFGNITDTEIKIDVAHKQDLHIAYCIPQIIDSTVNQIFHQANFSHVYTQLASICIQENRANLICIIGTNSFTAVLKKEDDKLQIVQHFMYSSPEDVSYHLLNICRNYHVSLPELSLCLFGMIDSSSNLYTELYKYFIEIEFGTLPDAFVYPEEIKEYPSHYFAHHFLLASCV